MSLRQEFATMVPPWALAAGVWRPKNAVIRNRTMAPYMTVSVTSTGGSGATLEHDALYRRQ